MLNLVSEKRLTDQNHTSLKSKTPFEKYQELENQIPTIQEIHKIYDIKKKELFRKDLCNNVYESAME